MHTTSYAQPATARAGHAAGARLFDGDERLLEDDTVRANWAVPWSDLMMTMFVLFAALLAAQTFHNRAEHKKLRTHEAEVQRMEIERDKPVVQEIAKPVPVSEPVATPAPEQSPDPGEQLNLFEQSREAIRDSMLQDVELAVLDDQSVKVSVQGPMFFAPGKADLRPEVTNFLDRIATVIGRTPYDIRIVGHTDDRAIRTGMFPSNWELSLVRASRVARYLIDAGGIDPARFSVVGRGEFAPVSANTDERSRAMNRRVEIIITRDIGKTLGANHP